MKLRVHLVGEGVNEIHYYTTQDVQTADKWARAFRKLVEDAIKDQADVEIIVIRGVSAEKDHGVKAPLYI